MVVSAGLVKAPICLSKMSMAYLCGVKVVFGDSEHTCELLTKLPQFGRKLCRQRPEQDQPATGPRQPG